MSKTNLKILLVILLAMSLVFSGCAGTASTEQANDAIGESDTSPDEATTVVEPTQSEEIVATSAETANDEPIVFRFPLTSDPSSLEAGISQELYSQIIYLNLHIGLFNYDENTKIVPYAVKEYEVSDDGTVYTFHLYENIYWHNGRQLVASDFKKGWERHMDPNVGAQDAGAGLSAIVGAQDVYDGNAKEISGVKVIDDYTLEVTLIQPSLSFLDTLATTSASWIVPEEAVKPGEAGWVDQPVGAGPFKFVEWQPNIKIVLEANADFFQGKPAVDRIEFLIVPDNNTALAMYEAGELDVAGVPSSELSRLDPTGEVHYWTKGQLQYFGMNQSMFEPFKDVRVRQAFNYAIDRKTIIETVLNGVLQPATGLVPPNIPEYNADLTGYEYNPTKAQELMAEAGFPNGEGFPKLELATLSSTVAEAVVAQLTANLGIEAEVLQPERGDMITGLWDHNRWQFFYFGWTADSPTASIWTYQMLYSGLDSNFSTYSNAEVDALVDNARNATDAETATQYWQEAEKLAVEDAALIPFGYTQNIYIVKPNISGFNCNLLGVMGFEKVTISN